MNNFLQALDNVASATIDRVIAHLPQLLGAMALLALGWFLARVLRVVTQRGVQLLDSIVRRSTGRSRFRIGRTGAVLGTIVYWVVLLFFVAAAAQTAGLDTFTTWLSRLLDNLPTVAAGLLIIGAGYLLSGFVGEIVQAAATGLPAPQRLALARAAQGSTLVVALLVGADQIGLKVTWIAIFAALVVASVLGGLAIAVSLGSRGYVANLIGAHHLRQALQPGQRVRVAGHEGRIVDITATSLVLETTEGRVVLPGKLYHDLPIELVARAADAVAAEAG